MRLDRRSPPSRLSSYVLYTIPGQAHKLLSLCGMEAFLGE